MADEKKPEIPAHIRAYIAGELNAGHEPEDLIAGAGGFRFKSAPRGQFCFVGRDRIINDLGEDALPAFDQPADRMVSLRDKYGVPAAKAAKPHDVVPAVAPAKADEAKPATATKGP